MAIVDPLAAAELGGVRVMEIADILNANMGASLRLSLASGIVLVGRVENVDDREHDDVFVRVERLIEGLGKTHLVSGTILRIFFSDITHIERHGQLLYERSGA